MVIHYSLQVYDVHAQKEDVLILATDGILDNLFEGQIVAIVSAVHKAGGGPEVRNMSTFIPGGERTF